MTTQTTGGLSERRRFSAALREMFPGLPRSEQLRRLRLLLGGVAPEAPTGLTETLTFSLTVPAATQDTQRRYVGAPSTLVAAWFNFPPGPSYLMEVRVLYRRARSERQIVPAERGTFVALDNTILPLTGLSHRLTMGSELIVEWNNHDDSYSHTVPVTLIIRRT